MTYPRSLLGAIFRRDFSQLTLDHVATTVSELLEDPNAVETIKEHTGFTNFYNAYRKAAQIWIRENSRRLTPLFRRAFDLSADDDGRSLVGELEGLDGIPKPNSPEIIMRPEYLLTPAFFALDERLRFPLINGNDGVQNLLRVLGVSNSSLEAQYARMIDKYGQGGIKDAADLDQAGPDLHDFISKRGTPPTKGLLVKKPIDGSDLPLKDESDVLSVQSAQTISSKRLHNSLTNKLRTCLSSFVLYEGQNKDIMFDAMVKNYNGKDVDLLIEVKTSVEIAHVRMAVGQLYSYSYRLDAERQTHLAVLLPERPPSDVMEWLEWLDIGVLWFSQNELCTSNAWLNTIAKETT